MQGMSASPSLVGFVGSLRASGTPQGRRSAICRDALGVLHPVGMAGAFHLRVVCGEGITGLGVLGAPSSLILENSSNHLW